MKELSKLSIELEINFKMDILKVSKAKARKEGIKMNPRIENLKGKLIVSCQALPDEPRTLLSLWEEWHLLQNRAEHQESVQIHQKISKRSKHR